MPIFQKMRVALADKLNPAQRYTTEKTISSTEPQYTYTQAYEQLEVVNRGVNMIVDDCATIPVRVGDVLPLSSVVKGVRKSRVDRLLNHEPNPFQDINSFRRDLIIDYLLDGNIFIYYDGVHLYHLPANKMIIHSSETTYIERFSFDEKIDYSPSEIILVRDNSFASIYRGVSRLRPAQRSINLMINMRNFQSNFFQNGAVPGLMLSSPNTLSEKIKERMLTAWETRYNPKAGGTRPMILDGGLTVESIGKADFREMDFQESIKVNENTVLKALGIPPIMLDSGNNANIRPNMRMYYLETVLPILRKLNTAFERFFGFEIVEDVSDIPALQPEVNEQTQYYSTLVNTGIITPNEARLALGHDVLPGADELRIPANIAGSAANPSEGGRPEENEDD